MRTTQLTRLIATGLAVALAAPGAALAKTVCIHSAADAGWTFVLRDISLRPGSSGAASGYALRDDGIATPMSGGYVVFPSTLLVGITQYFTGFDVVDGTGGTTDQTAFHQITVRVSGSPGADYAWTKAASAGITTAWGNAAIVDCRTVPPIPRAFP